MALDKADDKENRRRTFAVRLLYYVWDFPRSPTQYKDIYCVRISIFVLTETLWFAIISPLEKKSPESIMKRKNWFSRYSVVFALFPHGLTVESLLLIVRPHLPTRVLRRQAPYWGDSNLLPEGHNA